MLGNAWLKQGFEEQAQALGEYSFVDSWRPARERRLETARSRDREGKEEKEKEMSVRRKERRGEEYKERKREIVARN